MNDSLLRYQVKQSKLTIVKQISAYEICQKLMSYDGNLKDDFYTAFNFIDDGVRQRFSAYGRLAEITVHLSQDKIIFSFEKDERSIITDVQEFNSDTTPYSLVFSHLNGFTKKVRNYLLEHMDLPDNHNDVVFFGGWKAVTRRNGIVELAKFTLPLITVKQQNNNVILTQFLKNWSEEISISRLLEENEKIPILDSLVVLSASYASNRQEYEEQLSKVVLDLKSLNVSKVVVSKKKDILFKTAPNPLAFAAKLASRHGQVYDYIFHWKNEKYWVGVSPEILLTKEKSYISTKPLAGTIRLDQSSELNIASDILKNDKKESKEHMLASNKLEEELQEVCIPGTVKCTSGKDPFGVGYAVHLRSVISGEVEDNVSSFDILAKIYPPATIWGIPEDWSGTIIKNFEKFDRGYFTGGLGYFTLNDNSNFSLVIRNASLNDCLLEVYAGSGIIDQSNPEKEWRETETKMTPILSVLED
ncbi:MULTISPECIES: chorismate-binding protein [Dickeya]|uniref:Anthranilate synthase, aminase component \|nr:MULTISPECIES: chorismate-binding protein [Dickeya]SLM62736.1 Anthranilate synthase, aminase component \